MLAPFFFFSKHGQPKTFWNHSLTANNTGQNRPWLAIARPAVTCPGATSRCRWPLWQRWCHFRSLCRQSIMHLKHKYARILLIDNFHCKWNHGMTFITVFPFFKWDPLQVIHTSVMCSMCLWLQLWIYLCRHKDIARLLNVFSVC